MKSYPTFGPCPYCGERMAFGFHRSSLAIGAVAGVITWFVVVAIGLAVGLQ